MLIGKNEPVHQKILDALNTVVNEDYMIYVRPNGEIAGLCPPASDQSYYDEQYETKRSRLKFWRLDGSKDLDPRDGISKKKGGKIDLLKLEMSGGIALTELTGSGERSPVYTGRQAKRIQDQDESVQAMSRELNRLGQEYKTKDRNYKQLQKKVNNLKEEKQEAVEDREHFRNANERLNKRIESLKARLQAKEEAVRELKRELEAFKTRHEDLAGEIEDIMQPVMDGRITKQAASGVDASPVSNEGNGQVEQVNEAGPEEAEVTPGGK